MAAVWAGALMLEHLGQQEAAGIVMAAVRLVAKEGPRTRDLGGTATTTDVERALVAALGK
jgi:tartrate dehydrogenase/decarboxylase/D-malate dehydrogenase